MANCEHKSGSYALYDARGIYCGQVCRRCEPERRRQFRAEVFTDPNYEASEDIEPEEY